MYVCMYVCMCVCMIQDHSDHGTSKEPRNPLWARISRFLWCAMFWMILDHWSWSRSSQRNALRCRNMNDVKSQRKKNAYSNARSTVQSTSKRVKKISQATSSFVLTSFDVIRISLKYTRTAKRNLLVKQYNWWSFQYKMVYSFSTYTY